MTTWKRTFASTSPENTTQVRQPHYNGIDHIIFTINLTYFCCDIYDNQRCLPITHNPGMSNGAMATYQIGASMSKRLAAIAPVAGSFHLGFNQAPTEAVPVFDLHGTSDNTVPANKTTSGDGWKYTKVNAEIVPKWAAANGCANPTAGAYTKNLGISTSVANDNKLGCVDWGCNVVSCSWSGGHQYFGGSGWFGGGAEYNGQLIWAFLSQHTKSSHIGKGLSEGETLPADYKLRLTNVTVVEEEEKEAQYITTAIEIAATNDFTFGEAPADADVDQDDNGWRTHYGNPKYGCRYDEDKIVLTNGQTTGYVCAPRRRASGKAEKASNKDADRIVDDSWRRSCTLGGMGANPLNGCPTDLPRVNGGKFSAYPQCSLQGSNNADDAESDRDTDSDQYSSAHCYLTCDPCRNNGLDACDDSAHDMCPKNAACVTGFLKNMKQGICLYGADSARPQKYHLGETSSEHCYEMVYHDDGFAQKGYVKGGCDTAFNVVDETGSEIICDGDSTANIKTCPDSQIEIFTATKGKE